MEDLDLSDRPGGNARPFFVRIAMPTIANSALDLIGDTPLVRLNRLPEYRHRLNIISCHVPPFNQGLRITPYAVSLSIF